MSRSGPSVVFDTAGGRRVGVGHLLRSIELADRLRRMGATISLLAPITGERLTVTAAVRHRLRVITPRTESPAVVVVDRPDTTANTLRRLHRRWPSASVIALDYYGPPVDGLVGVVNLNQARETRRRSPIRRHWHRRGLAYATLRSSFGQWRRVLRKPPVQVRRILIGFGGTDPHGWSGAAVDVVRSLVPHGVRIHVMTGRELTLQSMASEPTVTCHVEVSDPAPLIHGSDLAIIGGGTMMIEAACLGVPAVVLPRTGDERVFARQFIRAGAVRALKTEAGFPSAALRREAARLVDDQSARRDMRRAGRRLVDGRGADRVAKLIAAAAGVKT